MGEELKRSDVASINEILGRKYSVLDDGFVRVVDYMGSDASVVQAARVSYGVGTKKLSEDRGLIRYLMRHGHTTPFEMCEIKLHIRVPMDCWRQWIRHRTANVNEYSTRYSLAIDSAQTTSLDNWRLQSGSNKQGSSQFLNNEDGAKLSNREVELHRLVREVYDERIELNIAREQARKDLPLSTYTEAYWKIDLHNLFHFLALRMDAHAQFEIRSYAEIIGNEIVKKWVPLAWESFVDYRLKSLKLSRVEIELISSINAGDIASALRIATENGMLKEGNVVQSSRERIEFEKKLELLGILIPWL